MLRTVGERFGMSNKGTTTRRRYTSVLGGSLLRGTPMAIPVANKPAERSAAHGVRRITQLRFDVLMLLAVITLQVFGLIMVYSASYDYSLNWYDNAMTIFTRQLVWAGIGLIAFVALALFDYHIWSWMALPATGFTVLLLVIVLIANNVLNGAARTLLGGSVQPSELAKLITVVYLSVWLYAKRDQIHSMTFGLIPLGTILGIMGGLILLQPDLSAGMTIVILGGLLFFLAGGDWKQILLALVIAVVIGYIIIMFSDTGRARLTNYIPGLYDPTSGSYHVRRAFGAFAKGGWIGVGIGNAENKLTGLPVPPTDSIFAVIGEETGVAGAVGLAALYVVILWRGLSVARRAPDEMGSLLASGLSLWIALEAFINMAVILNLLPFAGNALPFISAGGSNLVMTWAAAGIIMNVSRLTVEKGDEPGRLLHAVVDLRRRDGRRSVPGAGSPANNAQPETGAAQSRHSAFVTRSIGGSRIQRPGSSTGKVQTRTRPPGS